MPPSATQNQLGVRPGTPTWGKREGGGCKSPLRPQTQPKGGERVGKYTDNQRAAALAALTANGGNLKRTSDELHIPRGTLRGWAQSPQLAELRQENELSLTDELERVAYALVRAIPDKIHEASLNHISVSLGIAIDKLRLLRGEATEVTEVRGSDAKRELAERLARLAVDRPQASSPPN